MYTVVGLTKLAMGFVVVLFVAHDPSVVCVCMCVGNECFSWEIDSFCRCTTRQSTDPAMQVVVIVKELDHNYSGRRRARKLLKPTNDKPDEPTTTTRGELDDSTGSNDITVID